MNLVHGKHKPNRFQPSTKQSESKLATTIATHICFQQVVHGALGHLFGLMELLQGLPDLFILDFTLAFLFIVIVQATTLQLFQVVL